MKRRNNTEIESMPIDLRQFSCLRLCLWFILLFVFVFLYISISGFTATDSFISFRYARNWAIGNGIVFTPGERVEGFTNFLWVAILAILHQVPRVLEKREYFPFAVKVLAVFFPIAVLMVFNLSIDKFRDKILCSLFLILSPGFVLWAVSGMETVPFAFLILMTYYLLTKDKLTNLLACTTGLLCTLTAMMRPEGLLFVSLGIVYLGRNASKGRVSWKITGLVVLIFLIFFGAYSIWRIQYFGHLLPNTFHAKVGTSGAQVARGARYFWRWATALYFVPLFPVVLNLRGFIRNEARHLVSIAVIVFALYVVLVGGDWMGDHRFFIPVLPLVAWSYSQFITTVNHRSARKVFVIVFATVQLFYSIHQWKTIQKHTRFSFESERNSSGYVMADYFNQLPCNNGLIAMGSLGNFNYYSNNPVVDTLGLTDLHIARKTESSIGSGSAGHEKKDPEYVLSREPMFFMQMDALLTSVKKSTSSDQAPSSESTIQNLLRKSPEFKENYVRQRITWKNRSFTIFVRKDALDCLSASSRSF